MFIANLLDSCLTESILNDQPRLDGEVKIHLESIHFKVYNLLDSCLTENCELVLLDRFTNM